MDELTTINWDDVLDTLEAQKCILFLGQGAYRAPGGGDLEQALMEWIDVHNTEHPHIRLYNEDGFFLFRKNRYKRKVIAQIKAFYNQAFPEVETMFSRLAQIPFNMVFTLTPDNIFARTLDTYGFEYESDFYFRNRKASEEFELPTKQKPLIYNLLGNIEEPESIILTHQDFFDYLGSVFKGNSMNEDLKTELENAERYIFLGLPYEKWYFQLLLRVLSMHSYKLKEVERLALKEFEDPNLHEIYTEEFKIEFVPTEISAFVDTLHQKCKEEGILKPLPTPDPKEKELSDFSSEHIKELVADAKTEEAMLHLKVLLQQKNPKGARLGTELIVLRNRYKLLRQREVRGTIYPQDFTVENNQVIEQLLSLIDKSNAL